MKVATLSQIAELLKKTEQSQRVLEEVTEGFTLDVVAEDGDQDETLSIDKLTNADTDIGALNIGVCFYKVQCNKRVVHPC